jgi:hypothetical protein
MMMTGPIISPEGGIFEKRFLVTIQAVTDKQSAALLADAVDAESAGTSTPSGEGNK